MSKQQEHTGWGIIAGLIALLLYLLSKGNSLLHETVSASIVTGAGTITSDLVTGAPQYDTRIPSTVPEQEAFAVPPINADGSLNPHPANPATLAPAPVGYTLWHNVADNSYWYLPQ